MRSRCVTAAPHFQHIFSGEGYSAGYYSYLWSEVLDADAFAAFTEAGDPFDPQVARRLHDFIYAAGNLRDPEDAYRGFRNRLPDVGPFAGKTRVGVIGGGAGAPLSRVRYPGRDRWRRRRGPG